MKAVHFFSLLLVVLLSTVSMAQQKPWDQLTSDPEANYYEIEKAGEAAYLNQYKGKGSGYKQFRQWLYLNRNKYDAEGNRIAVSPSQKAYLNKSIASTKSVGADPFNWKELGVMGRPKIAGRVSCFAVQHNDPNIVYVGSETGGVWKSINRGVSWKPVTERLDMDISYIEIDRNNPKIVYYCSRSGGVYKSINSGNSWTQLGMPDGRIETLYKLLINPKNPQSLISVTNIGVFQSYNGGLSWHSSFERSYDWTEMYDVEFKPNDTSIVYASGFCFVRSTDGGRTFRELGSAEGIRPKDGIDLTNGRMKIAVTPANPEFVYVAQAGFSAAWSSTYFSRLYCSRDGGSSFSVVGSPVGSVAYVNYFGYTDNGSDDGGQAYSHMDIAVSPVDVFEVHLAGVHYWKSFSGGMVFLNYSIHHKDVMQMAYVGNRLYLGHDGGFCRQEAGTETWEDLSSGLNIAQVYKIAVAKTNDLIVSAGVQDNGSSVYKNGLWRQWVGGDGFEQLIAPDNENQMINIRQYGDNIDQTLDGGDSRAELTRPVSGVQNGGWETPAVLSAYNSRRLYIGYDQVWLYNAGQWSQLPSLSESGKIKKMAVTKAAPYFLFASKGSSLYKIDLNSELNDPAWASAQWVNVTSTLGEVTAIATHPSNSNKVVVSTVGNLLYWSNDQGLTWSAMPGLPGGLGVNCAVISDFGGADGVYLGTSHGVYYTDKKSTDAEFKSWIRFGSGIPNAPVNDLEIHAGLEKIYAGTYGRGVWSCDIMKPDNFRMPDITLPSAEVTKGGLAYNYYEVEFKIFTEYPEVSVKNGIVVKNAFRNNTLFDLGLRDRSDRFAMVYEGYLEILKDGVYTFYTKSDEGSRIYIGEDLVVNNDGLHDTTVEQSGNYALKKGLHQIKIEYFDATGFQALKVMYEGPGITKRTMRFNDVYYKNEHRPSDTPSSYYYLGNGVNYSYFESTIPASNVNEMMSFDHYVGNGSFNSGNPFALSNANKTDNFGFGYHGYFYAPTTDLYTFYLTSDAGSILTIGGNTVIQNDGVHNVRERYNNVLLSQGYHYFYLSYFEDYGDQTLLFEVASSSISRRAVTLNDVFYEYNDPNCPKYESSINMEFYEGQSWNSNFITSENVEKIDHFWYGSPNPLVPADNWYVVYTGGMSVDYTEPYTFYTVSDGKVRLYVGGGSPIINNWTDHDETENQATVNLVAGRPYYLDLEYYNTTGPAKIQLYYSSPSTPKQLVPKCTFCLYCRGSRRMGGEDELRVNDVSEISVSPNPLKDGNTRLVFTSASNQDATITIVDMSSREVYSRTVGAVEGTNEVVLTLGELGSGIYLLTITNSQGVVIGREKLVK